MSRSNYYVVKRQNTVFEEYALFVADKIDFSEYDGIWWELSYTDNAKDASKFSWGVDAFEMMMNVGLHKDDWDIVLYEGTK